MLDLETTKSCRLSYSALVKLSTGSLSALLLLALRQDYG